MQRYISFLEEAVRRKRLAYSLSDNKHILVVVKRFGGTDGAIHKIVLLNHPGVIIIKQVFCKPVEKERLFRAWSLINKFGDVEHGTIECQESSNCLVFSGKFSFVEDDDPEVIKLMVEFFCEYFFDMLPHVMANLYCDICGLPVPDKKTSEKLV